MRPSVFSAGRIGNDLVQGLAISALNIDQLGEALMQQMSHDSC